MAKFFNITGTCIPERHYMADTSRKMAAVRKMVDEGVYFTINRPRQFGKTTTIAALLAMLEKDPAYFVMQTSFEGIGDSVFENEEVFGRQFIELLAKAARFNDKPLAQWLKEQRENVGDFDDVSDIIAEMVARTGKKTVILIDEVDKSSNNQLFVSFLAMLRNKYLDAQQNRDRTFHSIVLAGVHDVKTLKLKLRPNEEQKFNSPWNIAADFKVNMHLLPDEIVPMLEEYQRDSGAKFDARHLAERLFYFTSGYPFLVSKLCKTMAEEIVPARGDNTWTDEDLERTVMQIVGESNTNFDSIIKNLEAFPDLWKLTYAVLIEGTQIPFSIHEPNIMLGVVYGIFSDDRSKPLHIHNRVYEELLFDYMSVKTIVSLNSQPNFHFPGGFRTDDMGLDMEKVLLRFQQFMREQFNKKNRDFLEKQGRLVFLSFIKPIINGGGYDFKEVQISEEQRLDVVITFYQHRYVAELKIWRGEKAHQRGLEQLSNYLQNLGLTEGFLLIFDHSAVKKWNSGWLDAPGGKRVFAVWV